MISTADLAGRVRRSLRDRGRPRRWGRRLKFHLAKFCIQIYVWVLVSGFALAATFLLIFMGTEGLSERESILTLNALGSAFGVFLIANTKLILDRNDLPRMDTLAVLPWTDRQWFYEFLKCARITLVLPVCFTAITFYWMQVVLFSSRSDAWILAALGVSAQWAIILATGLWLSNATAVLAQSPRLSILYRVIQYSLLAATIAMAFSRTAPTLVALLFPWVLIAVPTAWPAGVLYLAGEGLFPGRAMALLSGLCVTALVIGAVALRRLAASFKIAEISLDPWGGGYVIRHFVWTLYEQVRQRSASAGVEREQAAADGEPAVQSGGDSVQDPDARAPFSDQDLGRPLDEFWVQQGSRAAWFSPAEKNVIALAAIVGDHHATPRECIYQSLAAMLLLSGIVVIAPHVSVAAAGDQGETILVIALALMAMMIPASFGPDVSAAYRALPLTAAQWLWPRVKFQWLRLSMLAPPGVLLLMGILWNMGKSGDEILKWTTSVVVIPFLIVPLVLVLAYNEGCRDRWYRLASIWFVTKTASGLILLVVGGIFMFWPAWPANLWGILVATAATAILWYLICRWYDHGPVDAPIGTDDHS